MRIVSAFLMLTSVVQGQTVTPHGRPAIRTVGAAKMLGGVLRLTPAEEQTVGAAWFLEKLRVTGGFEVAFRFRITDPDGLGPGADGFAFVLQNEGPHAMAGRGSAGGFALGDGNNDRSKPGIPRSIAVFFDTFRNDDGKDPSDNYIGICTNGPIGKMKWPSQRLGMGQNLKVRLKDGREHTVQIRYVPPILSVSIDGGAADVEVPVDLSTVVDTNGAAYAGFTASTGGGYENHDILDWSLSPAVTSDMFVVQSEITYHLTNCLSGKNLCTPPEAVVEEKGPGEYHIVLPAQIEWAASIPNSEMRTISITNQRGTACWDLENAGAAGCGGPEGARSNNADASSRAEFLSPEQNPGALIIKTERGRSWFSVNGRKGRGFKENQGFFEFDVRLN